jgi:hypothetical protein
MSFRNEGSRHINDPEAFESLRAHPRLQSPLGNQIYPAPNQTCEFLGQQFKLDHADTCFRLKLDQDVYVAIRTPIAAGSGPKQTKLFDTVTEAHLRERRAVDQDATGIQRLPHSFRSPLCPNA